MKYDGYLAPHVRKILKMYREGCTARQISVKLYNEGVGSYNTVNDSVNRFLGMPVSKEENIRKVISTVNYILSLHGMRGAKPPFDFRDYSEARTIHAFLLRCEGKKFHEIAPMMGVSSPERARQLVMKGSRRIQRAVRHARFTTGGGNEKVISRTTTNV
jgi:hypothetical protein